MKKTWPLSVVVPPVAKPAEVKATVEPAPVKSPAVIATSSKTSSRIISKKYR